MSEYNISANGIDLFASMSLSSTYQTVYNQIKEILINHNSSVETYINQNVYYIVLI